MSWSRKCNVQYIQNICCVQYSLYTRKLWYKHFTLDFWLCELIALEHKFKRWFCTQKPVLKVSYKDLWYTKINLSQKYIFMPNKILLHIIFVKCFAPRKCETILNSYTQEFKDF